MADPRAGPTSGATCARISNCPGEWTRLSFPRARPALCLGTRRRRRAIRGRGGRIRHRRRPRRQGHARTRQRRSLEDQTLRAPLAIRASSQQRGLSAGSGVCCRLSNGLAGRAGRSPAVVGGGFRPQPALRRTGHRSGRSRCRRAALRWKFPTTDKPGRRIYQARLRPRPVEPHPHARRRGAAPADHLRQRRLRGIALAHAPAGRVFPHA